MFNKNSHELPDMKRIKSWVFDLDNTLYPHHVNLFSQVDQKMGRFIQEMFDISYDEAKLKQKHFFMKYGTTLRGLMTEHGIEPHEYLNFVHNIDFSVLKVDQTFKRSLG